MKKLLIISGVLLLASTAYATTTPPLRPEGVMKGIREKVGENIEKNKDIRNQIRQEKVDAIKNVNEAMKKNLEALQEMKKENPEGFKIEKREIRATARKDEALIRKDALLKQLNLSLDNQAKTAKALADFISKRTSEGKSVGNASTLLADANTKIEASKKAVAALAAWVPEKKTASSTEISLARPRETANTAIKAVKESREALGAVIKELRNSRTNTASTTETTIETN